MHDSYVGLIYPLRAVSSLPGVTLHRIEDDLRGHAWYEELFVRTIADVEAFAGRWAAFEEAVAVLGDGRFTQPVHDS